MFSNERSHQRQYPTGCGREDCTICYEEPQENAEEGPEFPLAPGSYQWSDDLTEEEMKELKRKLAPVKEESTLNFKEKVDMATKSLEKERRQSERDDYDEQYYANIVAPDPYSEWLENTRYMSKEEVAQRYARYGTALQEIHKMALDSFSGKPLPETKYMLGLCLGLAGGALNYDFGANRSTT